MSLSRRFADLRIGYKLLLGYSTIFIFSCALASVIIYFFVRHTIQTNIESELNNTTTTILNMVRASVDVSIKNHLRAVAEKNREIAEYYYQSFRRGLISEQQAISQTKAVFLSQTIGKTGYIYCLDSNGIIVMHPQAALLGVDLSPNAFIQDQKKRKSGYLEYDWKNPGEAKARAKALYMTYFAPWDWIISVSSYRAEFKELVNVEDFRDRILSLKFGHAGYSYVIDSKGNLIVHPILQGENIYHEKDPQGRMFIKELCERKSGKIIYPWKNPGETNYREKLVMFNYIPELDWIVASSSYQDEFYAPLKTVNRIFVATVALSLLLVLPITLLITASITTPLRSLMNRFSVAADGDITVRMTRQSRDEVGMLARYFNAFMDRLEIFSQSLKAEISDRKKAEEAIRKSEAKYRELVQNANSIIIRVDTQGRITFFNEFAQSFFGYSEEEILGRNSVGTIMPLRDSAGRSMREMMDRVAKAPEDYRYYEVENMRRNGERVWVAWTNKAVRDGDGQVAEYLIIGHDITEAKEAEQEMARMRHYLKNIIDSMPSILVGVDLATRVTQWNREAIKITGIDQHQALGTEVQKVLPHFQEHMEMVRRAIREKAPKKVEKMPHPIKGSGHFADIMVYPIILDQVAGAVIRIDDVTARARMEDMMVQTEKMMSVGGLAAGMAHEINNPIGGILQSAQNIQRRLSPELEANHKVAGDLGLDLTTVHRYLQERSIIKFLQAIREAGERASKTVQNMLNFSRTSESRKTRVELCEVLDKMVEMAAQDYDLKKKYDFRHIRIQREYVPDMATVPCVVQEIEQVILNILRNAAQAMGDMKIRTQPPAICLRLYQNNGSAVIEIQDNGPGMDEKVRKRIFEPFFTTKEVGVGTGLGLSVSYFIITNNHGGSMAVESTPDKGAKFIIQLPLAGNELN